MGKDDIFILIPPAREILDALVEPNFPQAPLCSLQVTLYRQKLWSASTQFCLSFFPISNFAHALSIISKLHGLRFVATIVLWFCVTSNVLRCHQLTRQEFMFT
jgi:hypothetical protein